MSSLYRALAATAILIGSAVGHAQADTVWRYPYKGSPYAVESGSSAREIIKPRLSKAERVRAGRTHKSGENRPWQSGSSCRQ